ncbi:phage portal protein [Empedobacter stercoris]|uniref:phage portal protein n=1 Tax=Empedobacter stercoris TaxID=1628248 RepID=UPI001CE118FD|nr:phage portal protein [Empedobacter stercoris]MCA4782336.1 phage portal protein [Empedobacter stercoris]
MNELCKLLNIPENSTIQKIIETLKQGKDKTKIIEEARKQLDPKQHDIMNPHLRRRKNKEDSKKDDKKMNMIAVAYQKIIVKKEKAMIFGNQPILNSNPDGDVAKLIVKAIERILHDIKESSFNRKLAESVGSYTEGGELWYLKEDEEEHETYGFKTKMKIKAMLLSLKNGSQLYPTKDDFDDMIAFSRNYIKKIEGKDVEFFEVYTQKFTYLFSNFKEWEIVEGYPRKQQLEKIPAVFAEQDFTSWYDVQWMIERLETLLSDHAEVNDRNAYPVLLIEGDLQGSLEKGPGGGLKLKNGSKASYLSWSQATDSIKLEIENLISNIQMITQTPNISFDEVKNLGALSGTALKMLFLDAHLKVMEKREIYDEYLQRRINIIKRILATLKPEWKTTIDNLVIEPEIVPFMVENEKEQVEIALLKNGNKPLESHEKSVKNWQGQDTEDYEEIKKEEKEASNLDYFNPASE